jgi:hypothetical protein
VLAGSLSSARWLNATTPCSQWCWARVLEGVAVSCSLPAFAGLS